MNLDRWKIEFRYDVGIFYFPGFFKRLAFQPLCGQAGAGYGGAAAEGFEPGVYDRILLNLDLEFHYVTAFWGPNHSGPDSSLIILEAPHVSGVVEVVNDFIAIGHSVALPR